MRRRLIWSLMALTAVVLVLALIVNLRVDDADELPAPDARLPIRLPDGEVVPLADLLARLRDGVDTPPASHPLVADEDRAGSATAALSGGLYPGMPWGPLFKLAEHHRQAGRLDQAVALYQSIPESDPDYAISRRRIALDLLDRIPGRTARAVPFANAALLHDPFDLNSWEVLARAYAAGLGLDSAGGP